MQEPHRSPLPYRRGPSLIPTMSAADRHVCHPWKIRTGAFLCIPTTASSLMLLVLFLQLLCKMTKCR